MTAILVIAGTFLLCWLVDKGFTKLFRSQPQHASGKAVRLNKFYSLGGLLLTVIGACAIFAGLRESMLLLTIGGAVMVLLGIALIVYYITFGIYYDSDSFLYSAFGKKSSVYRYGQIKGQLLYRNGGQVLIELHMNDGQAIHLQSTMKDAYLFLDTAFEGWCKQRGLHKENCSFHDPDNSCWFPPAGE